MIRQATKYDKDQIKELMLMFKTESQIKQYQDIEESEYWHRLIDNILSGQGIIFIKDNIGLIAGIVFPTIWSDKIYALHELAWYVKPEFRNTTAGHRLLSAYIDHGKQLKESGRIAFFTLSKLPNTKIDYARFGFSKMDENWIQ